jgi:hypothetical protein
VVELIEFPADKLAASRLYVIPVELEEVAL